jgi:hypothetical protein
MLAQVRKYRLNVTLTFQFLDQFSQRTQSAILGSVGTLLAFRSGDADLLEKEFRPQFKSDYIRTLPNYRVVYRRLGGGMAALPGSTDTLPLLARRGDEANRDTILRMCRERYARPRLQVEQKIFRQWGMP